MLINILQCSRFSESLSTSCIYQVLYVKLCHYPEFPMLTLTTVRPLSPSARVRAWVSCEGEIYGWQNLSYGALHDASSKHHHNCIVKIGRPFSYPSGRNDLISNTNKTFRQIFDWVKIGGVINCFRWWTLNYQIRICMPNFLDLQVWNKKIIFLY